MKLNYFEITILLHSQSLSQTALPLSFFRTDHLFPLVTQVTDWEAKT